MKKTVLYLLSVSIVINIAGCAEQITDVKPSENYVKSSESYVQEEPPPKDNVSFDKSYKEMTDWFTEQSEVRNDLEKYENYKQMADKIRKNRSVAIPAKDGEPAKLRQSDGYSAITVFADERYDKPWIWYHCTTEAGEEYCICISYLTAEEKTLAEGKTYSEFLKEWKPSEPNIYNATEYSDVYQSIIEKELELADITVLSIKQVETFEESDPRIRYTFIYDDILVSAWSFDDVFTDDFWSHFCLTDIVVRNKYHYPICIGAALAVTAAVITVILLLRRRRRVTN